MTDLHGASRRAVIGGAHALGVIRSERHRLLLIDVLAGVERGGEAFGMQVLRRCDEDGVDGFVVEQMAVVKISLGVGRGLLDLFQAIRINIEQRRHVRRWAAKRPGAGSRSRGHQGR